jgi:hypothetical protein
MDDPLDFVDFSDVLQHGDPSNWTFVAEKAGSGVPAHSSEAPPGTLKIYEIYLDEFGVEIELHYFRHADGTVSGAKITPRS